MSTAAEASNNYRASSQAKAHKQQSDELVLPQNHRSRQTTNLSKYMQESQHQPSRTTGGSMRRESNQIEILTEDSDIKFRHRDEHLVFEEEEDSRIIYTQREHQAEVHTATTQSQDNHIRPHHTRTYSKTPRGDMRHSQQQTNKNNKGSNAYRQDQPSYTPTKQSVGAPSTNSKYTDQHSNRHIRDEQQHRGPIKQQFKSQVREYKPTGDGRPSTEMFSSISRSVMDMPLQIDRNGSKRNFMESQSLSQNSNGSSVERGLQSQHEESKLYKNRIHLDSSTDLVNLQPITTPMATNTRNHYSHHYNNEISMDHISQSTGHNHQHHHQKAHYISNDLRRDESSEKKLKKKAIKKQSKQIVAPKIAMVCSDFQCKSKLAIQSEILEKVVKDKDRVQTENNALKNELELEINLLYRAVLGGEEADKEGAQLSWKQKVQQVKVQYEKTKNCVQKKPEPQIEKPQYQPQKPIFPDETSILLGTHDQASSNLKELYNDYFKLRETNVEGRADVYVQLYTQARNIDLERRKMMAETDVMRLKDKNNSQTMLDLEAMFAGEDLSQKAIYNQLTALNDKFHQQNLDLNKQIAQIQAKVTYQANNINEEVSLIHSESMFNIHKKSRNDQDMARGRSVFQKAQALLSSTNRSNNSSVRELKTVEFLQEPTVKAAPHLLQSSEYVDNNKLAQLLQERDELRRQIQTYQMRQVELESILHDQRDQINHAERTVKDLTDAQLEMKSLIDQERSIYNEDREKLEDDIARVKKTSETKIRLIRNKLLTLYDGDIDRAREYAIEELVDRIHTRLSRFRNSNQVYRSMDNKEAHIYMTMPQQSQTRLERHHQSSATSGMFAEEQMNARRVGSPPPVIFENCYQRSPRRQQPHILVEHQQPELDHLPSQQQSRTSLASRQTFNPKGENRSQYSTGMQPPRSGSIHGISSSQSQQDNLHTISTVSHEQQPKMRTSSQMSRGAEHPVKQSPVTYLTPKNNYDANVPSGTPRKHSSKPPYHQSVSTATVVSTVTVPPLKLSSIAPHSLNQNIDCHADSSTRGAPTNPMAGSIQHVAQQQPANNLANIIESFKKEKSAFNERFSELKKRLDTFNSKRNTAGTMAPSSGSEMFNKTAPSSQSLQKIQANASSQPFYQY